MRPRNPQYGSVHSYPNTKHSFEDGEFIEYQCNSGYQLQGNARVSCSNGVWGDKPVCRGKQSFFLTKRLINFSVFDL